MRSWLMRGGPLALLLASLPLFTAATARAQADPAYYLRLTLGRDYVGTGGEDFLVNYQSTPIAASHYGCNKPNGSTCGLCPGGAIRYEGNGSALVGPGSIQFTISSVNGCPGWQLQDIGRSRCAAEMFLNDVVFTDGSGGSGSIPVSLNLETLHAETNTAGQFSWLHVFVKIGNSTVVPSNQDPGSGLLTTDTAMVPLNQPVTVFFSLVGEVYSGGTVGTMEGAVSFVSSNGGNSPGVHGLASMSPVFNVPAGVTVNSVQGNIVDNTWNAPVPVQNTTWGQLKSLYE